MGKKVFSAASASPFLIEPLEERSLLSATVGTSTVFSASTLSDPFGGSLTLSVKVRPEGAAAQPPTGIVEFLVLENKKQVTFTTATITHTGHASFTFSSGNSLFVGNYTFSARYLGDTNFVGSISRKTNVAVASPSLTVESNGLELATTQTGTGKAVKNGDELTVQYTGYLETTGQIFDDSAEHAPSTLQFTLGGNFIGGWNAGILGMKLGETRVIVIPQGSTLGYGNNPPSGSIITDGAALVFVVHVVSVP